MSMRIYILVGTMTGTAQLCAQEMELALDDGETQVATLMMDQLDSSVFEKERSRAGVFLICTSTYGQGDVPDNARSLYEDLKARRPDLSHVLYGVFGARRVGERHMHDASSGVLPEETALEWCQEWLAKVKDCVAAG